MSAGHIRRRGSGSWELKFDLGQDDAGRRLTKYASFKGTKTEAQRKLRELMTAADAGVFCDPGRLTLGAYLKAWHEGRRHAISPKTHERYGEHIERHIAPRIGGIELRRVSTITLNRFYADLLASGRLDGRGGLAPQTVRHIDRLLHVALRHAVRQRLIAINPADEAERPKVQRQAHRGLADDELAHLLATAEQGRSAYFVDDETAPAPGTLYVPLFTIFATGLRRGELLALTWRNVDLDAATLAVVATVEETAEGIKIKEPKTASSRRRVDLPATLVELLREHRARQRKDHLRFGIGWTADTLVFSTPLGELQRPRNFTKAVSRIAKRAGLAGVSPHLGRHDHFSRLLAAGVHPKVAQQRAGHSSITVTLDIYSHATESLQKAAVERIDDTYRTLRAASGGNPVAIAPIEPKRPLLKS